MRTWGRSGGIWVMVITDPNGEQDQIWLTSLTQVLKLQIGESPFFAGVGLPAQQSVLAQIYPDYYVTLVQQSFAPHFAALSIARAADYPPTYDVHVVSHAGVTYDTQIEVPQ